MNQDEIYSLLLVLLLMSNERENSENFVQTTRGALNEIILTAMLLGSRNSADTDRDDDNFRCCPGVNRNNNNNTTF